MTISDSPLILVVDDDEHAARRVEKTLVPQGYDVIIANDGAQALARAAETPPDLVVLDVLMPELDGFDTARALRTRAESRAIPILMVTALNDLNDKIKGLESGADRLLRPIERLFFYLPFEHSEDLADQDRSVELFRELVTSVETAHRETFAGYTERIGSCGCCCKTVDVE